MKKEFKTILSIGVMFLGIIIIGMINDDTENSKNIVGGTTNTVSNISKEDNIIEENNLEEQRLEEEKQAEERKKIEAEAARIAEEKRLEEERLRQEAEIEEAKRIEAERKAAEEQKVQTTDNSNFYVSDGTASHDHSTGYDSPYSDPNEPVITEEYGYVADGNNYIHKTSDCKFIRDKVATQVPVSSSGKASCNCWYY